jgi:hypothetical protein
MSLAKRAWLPPAERGSAACGHARCCCLRPPEYPVIELRLLPFIDPVAVDSFVSSAFEVTGQPR